MMCSATQPKVNMYKRKLHSKRKWKVRAFIKPSCFITDYVILNASEPTTQRAVERTFSPTQHGQTTLFEERYLCFITFLGKVSLHPTHTCDRHLLICWDLCCWSLSYFLVVCDTSSGEPTKQSTNWRQVRLKKVLFIPNCLELYVSR